MRCGVCGQRYGDYIIPHGQTDCTDDRKAEAKPYAPVDDDMEDYILESEIEDE